MRVLHYFLGFPPYRTGGLTKYACELMIAQKQYGDEVIALWPGQMGIIRNKVSFKKHTDVQGIRNIEVINPLPVSLDEGIVDINRYIKPTEKDIFVDFLQKVKPDVIHIHTLMGLYYEFVEAAKDLNINTVFTTHDYFGICPKVTLYRNGGVCSDDNGCEECVKCNKSALSFNKIVIMQSPLYRHVKDSKLVRTLRNRHRARFFYEENCEGNDLVNSEVNADEYIKLRQYYIKILETMEMLHFNSSVSESIYRKYITPQKSTLMTITHKNVSDHRAETTWKWTGKLRITYLSPAKPFKGFTVLRNALDLMWEEGRRDITLNVFAPVENPSPYMNVKENGFTQDDLPSIFNETDILVAPSIWYETFGFTVLEAASYGIPVIVSENVGAKDVIGDGGIVVKAGDVLDLKRSIEQLDEETVIHLREGINRVSIKTWDDFLIENHQLYRGTQGVFGNSPGISGVNQRTSP